MKNVIRLSILAICALFVLSSCKKDDVKSKTDLLVAGPWKLVSDMEKIDNGSWSENIGTYAACELDDFILFKADHTYEYNEGPTKCNAGDPQSESGIWAFEASETKINIDGQSVILDELTSTTLSVSSSYTFGVNTFYSKQTLKH